MLAALDNFLPSFNNKNVSLGNLANDRKVIALCDLVGVRGVVSIVCKFGCVPAHVQEIECICVCMDLSIR